MYALKARDKLHKQQKEDYVARHSPRVAPKRKGGAYAKSPGKQSSQPVTVNREAKVDQHGGCILAPCDGLATSD